jgi:Fuc2NAc and GlcNAc transferase
MGGMQEMQLMLWLWPLAFLAAALLTGVIRRLALKRQVLDVPVARSAHSIPTPVGGGLSIVLLFALLSSYFYSQDLISDSLYLGLGGAIVVAAVGLFDDLYQLHVLWRMPFHFSAALWSVWWLGDIPAIDVAGFLVAQQWVLRLLAVLALVWLLNLYNFMDGIDGIAAAELLFVNLVSLMFVINTDSVEIALLSLVLISGAAGFLIWNWPPARIFMGDVGSGFCGFALGLLAIISMQSGLMTVWTWVILLGVFVTDSTFTLLRRLWRGERWYEGHASHAYQNAARLYKSHAKVTITILMINCLWLAPLAWVSVTKPELGFFLSLIALAPLVAVAYRLQAGTSSS